MRTGQNIFFLCLLKASTMNNRSFSCARFKLTVNIFSKILRNLILHPMSTIAKSHQDTIEAFFSPMHESWISKELTSVRYSLERNQTFAQRKNLYSIIGKKNNKYIGAAAGEILKTIHKNYSNFKQSQTEEKFQNVGFRP